jgi:hypothetical protein
VPDLRLTCPQQFHCPFNTLPADFTEQNPSDFHVHPMVLDEVNYQATQKRRRETLLQQVRAAQRGVEHVACTRIASTNPCSPQQSMPIREAISSIAIDPSTY